MCEHRDEVNHLIFSIAVSLLLEEWRRALNKGDDFLIIIIDFLKQNVDGPELFFVGWRGFGVTVLVVTVVLHLIRTASVEDVEEVLSHREMVLLAFPEHTFLMDVPLSRDELAAHAFELCFVKDFFVDLFFLESLDVLAR